MTKRAFKKFKRNPRDFYVTPFEPVEALFESGLIFEEEKFCEPCAGDGTLIKHLESFYLQCLVASDIEPKVPEIDTLDVFNLTPEHVEKCDHVITNPPWDRKILHPMIDHLCGLRPDLTAILLFDSDWAFTKQAAPYLKKYCTHILGVGRVSWMGNGAKGFDNASWYVFRGDKQEIDFTATIFLSKYVDRLPVQGILDE